MGQKWIEEIKYSNFEDFVNKFCLDIVSKLPTLEINEALENCQSYLKKKFNNPEWTRMVAKKKEDFLKNLIDPFCIKDLNCISQKNIDFIKDIVKKETKKFEKERSRAEKFFLMDIRDLERGIKINTKREVPAGFFRILKKTIRPVERQFEILENLTFENEKGEQISGKVLFMNYLTGEGENDVIS